jgi:hypothetical protein
LKQYKNNGLLLQCKINHRPNLRCSKVTPKING